MKTHNDRPSNHKGAPTPPNRGPSDPIRLSPTGAKDAKPPTPAKPIPTSNTPKSAVDVRAGGAASPSVASPSVAKPAVQADAKTGSPRADTERKAT